jgi:hypothetical protein
MIETATTHLDEEYAGQNADVVRGDYLAANVMDSGTGQKTHNHRARLRAVLHHQVGRQGHRLRPQHGRWLRQSIRRPCKDLQWLAMARASNYIVKGLPRSACSALIRFIDFPLRSAAIVRNVLQLTPILAQILRSTSSKRRRRPVLQHKTRLDGAVFGDGMYSINPVAPVAAPVGREKKSHQHLAAIFDRLLRDAQ